MKKGSVNVKHRLFSYYNLFYITFVFVCFTRVRQEELLKSLYRNMRYTPEHKNYIPAITLRRFLQLTEGDSDPSYRRQAVNKLDSNPDNSEQVNIFYSKEVRGEQIFNLSRKIVNISKIQRADLVIKDYDHSFKRTRVSILTGPHSYRHRHWKIARWTTEGHAINLTRQIRHRLWKGHRIIKIRVCVINSESNLQCRDFNKFSIALVIQLNVNLNVWHEFSTPYMDVLEKLSEREKYQTRTKRSENQELTETPMQDQPQHSVEPSVDHAESNICHVHPWTVAFADIGWSQVHAPLTVQANLCFGGCPSPLSSHDSLNYTFQSVIVDLYRTSHGQSANGIPTEPCCTPSEMAPLSVYKTENDGSHTLMRLEAIRVTACGCR